jgi:hypothetical protein
MISGALLRRTRMRGPGRGGDLRLRALRKDRLSAEGEASPVGASLEGAHGGFAAVRVLRPEEKSPPGERTLLRAPDERR